MKKSKYSEDQIVTSWGHSFRRGSPKPPSYSSFKLPSFPGETSVPLHAAYILEHHCRNPDTVASMSRLRHPLVFMNIDVLDDGLGFAMHYPVHTCS